MWVLLHFSGTWPSTLRLSLLYSKNFHKFGYHENGEVRQVFIAVITQCTCWVCTWWTSTLVTLRHLMYRSWQPLKHLVLTHSVRLHESLLPSIFKQHDLFLQVTVGRERWLWHDIWVMVSEGWLLQRCLFLWGNTKRCHQQRTRLTVYTQGSHVFTCLSQSEHRCNLQETLKRKS